MSSVPFSTTSSPPASLLAAIATSGALDEISNAPDAIANYLIGNGLVENGKTRRALFFAVYQTGRHGPQNGFRLCLVHEGFQIDSDEVKVAAAAEIAQDVTEFITLGEARAPIED